MSNQEQESVLLEMDEFDEYREKIKKLEKENKKLKGKQYFTLPGTF